MSYYCTNERCMIICRLRVSLIIKGKLVAALEVTLEVTNGQAGAVGHRTCRARSLAHRRHPDPSEMTLSYEPWDRGWLVGPNVFVKTQGAKTWTWICHDEERERERAGTAEVTGTGTEESQFDSWHIQGFVTSPKCPHRCGTHSLLFCAYLLGAPSSGVKAAWAWSWPFIPSSVEIKNECSHTSTPTICLHVTHSDNFTFTFTIT